MLCTLYYQKNPDTPDMEAEVRQFAEGNAGNPERFDQPGQPWCHPDWVANREGSAKRQRWIDKIRELGFFTEREEIRGLSSGNSLVRPHGGH